MRINRKKLVVAMLDADLNQKQLAEIVWSIQGNDQ